MPWLQRPNDVAEGDPGLLFVHVPRAGGTSLLQLFDVNRRARQGVNIIRALGRRYFAYRYRIQETANFPWKTYENAYALVVFIVATIIYFVAPERARARKFRACYGMWGGALVTFIMSTFVMVPAVVGRNTKMRRLFAWLMTYPLCGILTANEWLLGVSVRGGLLQHMTASDMVAQKFMSRETFDAAESFAVVRNPFSRMFSVYGYNRIGPLESFPAFVRRWRRK